MEEARAIAGLFDGVFWSRITGIFRALPLVYYATDREGEPMALKALSSTARPTR